MDLNRTELIGRLVKDPVSRKLSNGQKVTTFDLATNYSWQDIKTKEKKETVDFHSVVFWGRTAGVVEKYLKKGSRIFMSGRLVYRTWEDKTGTKKYKTEIIGSDLIMIDSKNRNLKKEELTEENITIEEVPVD